MLKNSTNRFGSMTKLLHWLLSILITAQFYLIWYPVATAERPLYMMLHKSIGMTILVLAVLFIVWHMLNKTPFSPDSQPYWQHITAKMIHYSLFVLILLMPIMGYLMSCANGRAVNFFGGFIVPCLISENKPLGGIFATLHEILGYLILILVGVHVLAALYHHFVVKDNVLRRMLPFT